MIYTYNGNYHTYTVPAEVTSITIAALGAQGGSFSSSYPGGLGALYAATFNVTGGEVFYVYVGGFPGTSTNAAGWNGGGPGSSAGGGGGGASDVRTTVASLSSRIIVAAGGGGIGHSNMLLPVDTANHSSLFSLFQGDIKMLAIVSDTEDMEAARVAGSREEGTETVGVVCLLPPRAGTEAPLRPGARSARATTGDSVSTKASRGAWALAAPDMPAGAAAAGEGKFEPITLNLVR